MRKFALLKTIAVAGGLVFLSAAPQLSHGEASQAPVAPNAPLAPAAMPRGKAPAAIDLLEGLTLTSEQKAKIDEIRVDTNVRMATVNQDKAIDAQTAEAMRRGYVRIENGKIFEVLTPEQQKQVRQRIAALKDPKAKPQYPMRRVPASAQASKAQ